MNPANSLERVLFSALQVFAAKGKHRATIEEIASKAGISKSFLHRNYPTKNDLYRKVLESVIETTFRQFEEAVGPLGHNVDAAQDILDVTNILLHIFTQNPHLAKILLYAIVDDTDEFLVVAKNVKSRVAGEKWATCKAVFERVACRVPVKDSGRGKPLCLLTVLVGMILTCLLGGTIAEVFIDMKVPNEEKVVSEIIKKNIFDWWI